MIKRSIQLVVLLLAALGVNAQYNSLLWKITGNGLKEPSYLYGTMHTADPRVIAASDRVKLYFNASKAYAMEIDPSDAMGMDVMGKLMMGKGHSLTEMIPAREYHILDSIVTSSVGLSMAMFDNVAPVFVMTIFESMSMGLADSVGDKTQVLDLYLQDKAKDAGKKVIGIETVTEQLDALGKLSYKEQADLLVQEIDSFEVNKGGGTDELQYYLKGDLTALATTDVDAKKPDKFYKALVLDRNVRMANRIAKFVKDQPTFVAIGALHLPGQAGVIELLRKKGYEVKPLPL